MLEYVTAAYPLNLIGVFVHTVLNETKSVKNSIEKFEINNCFYDV